MSHSKPHLDKDGLCGCDCRRCTIKPTHYQICICPKCDAPRCGMHDGVIPEVDGD